MIRIHQPSHTSTHRDFCLPYRNRYFLQSITVINDYNNPLVLICSCISQYIFPPLKHLNRTFPEHRVSLVDPDHFSVKCDQLLIFMPPRIRTSVVWIRKSAHAGLVAIINSWCARPRHLHNDRLTHNCHIDIFIGRFCPQFLHTADSVIRSRQESGMVMIRQFIHGNLQGRRHHIAHVMTYRIYKCVGVAS